MNCREARQLIDAYVDGELDLVHALEVETHLEDCGACLQAVKSLRQVSGALRGGSLRYAAPAGLENRVLAGVRKEAKKSAVTSVPGERRLRRFAAPAFAMAAITLIFFSWNAIRNAGGRQGDDQLAEEIVSSHVRSLMAAHLFDVASTDQHTVKPWFAGKLDFAPVVIDLKEKDYPLTGGRLDYIAGRPVAAMVYRHRKHVINLFEWPAPAGAAGTPGDRKTMTLRGYHTVEWSVGGMTFHAVSDVNPADLQAFAKELKALAGP